MLVVWGAVVDQRRGRLVLAGSDGLDGYMARRHGTTRSGAFLDPLADKAVVLGALFTLAAQGHLPWLPVILIAIREVGMSSTGPGSAGAASPSRPASRPSSRRSSRTSPSAPASSRPWPTSTRLQVAMIWFACALTLYTGAQYVLDGRRALHRPAAP